ncbi:MAG: adenosine kinase [Acidobacteria bacterium]|nr:adenosine kinase [Acidobacteriota bacterium]NIM60741.1 adenosine kinase [Acidobacteriota bacterium]NIO57954.1 adenosine kinase [Acidobacteriota bacterium]NIQ28959.1 adenosine kinase [Acidobacteriota bacterium]NIQ83431.1 adenosine kinase [Acidobacteriota bacterium]
MHQPSSGTTHDVIGLGNAIVDVLAHTDDRFLADHSLAKGAMTLIDAEQAKHLYALVTDTVECSGGSAANTMVGLASLGSRAAYIGKVCDDELGAVFTRDIRASGVTFRSEPADSGTPTARCLVLVSGDAQRTMLTFLGASAELAVEDVDPELIRGAGVTYLEGYLWDPEPAKQAFLKAAEIAHSADRLVALSLSDPFCVERHRNEFLELVENHIDILFANEEEIVSLYQATDFEAALRQLPARCRWAALTRGAAGAVVLHDGERVDVPAEPVDRVLDTTGAGDLFAAGFLHGFTRGHDASTCARLGAIAAAEAISHFGARPERDLEQLTAEVR